MYKQRVSKIAIVSLYGPWIGGNKNYGFTLQAYALQFVLKQMRITPELMAIVGNDIPDSKIKKVKSLTYILIKHPVQFIHKVIYKIELKTVYHKEYKGCRLRHELVNEFEKKYINKTEDIKERDIRKIISNYDAFISGSDQVFNPAYWMNSCFLDFVSDNKLKIAYAASVGVTEYTPEQEAFVKKNLQRFDAISVRKQSAKGLLDTIVDKEIVTVLDPTLLLSAEEWNSINPASHIDVPYILCYLMGENPLHRQYAKDLAKEMNVKLISVSDGDIKKKDMNLGDMRIYDADSARFIGLIRDAEVVLTDSFHGTVFSIIYRKKFFSLQRSSDADKKSMNTRLYDLLNMLGLQSRMITEKNPDFDLESSIDEIYKETEKILPVRIEYSKTWLKKVIEK